MMADDDKNVSKDTLRPDVAGRLAKARVDVALARYQSLLRAGAKWSGARTLPDNVPNKGQPHPS